MRYTAVMRARDKTLVGEISMFVGFLRAVAPANPLS
jgi:hypothetical protein